MPTPRDHAHRRQFLKSSVVAAAAAPLSLGRSAHAAGSDVLNIGVIGCGGRGAGAAANALQADPHSQLVALADVLPERIQASP